MKQGTMACVRLCALLATAFGAWSVPAKADPWINEIHYNNTGTDAGEFVEVAGDAGTALTGWNLVFYSGNNGTVYKTVSLSGTIPNQSNNHGTLAFALSGIQNGSPDGLALVNTTGVVVQFLSYDGTFTATAGPAAGKTSTDISVHQPDSTPLNNSLQLAGHGYDYSDFSWQDYTTKTQGTVNRGQVFLASKPAAPTPWINEFHYDNTGTDTGEFVEIAGADGTNLSGWKVLGYSGINGTVYKTLNLSGIINATGGCTGVLSFDFSPMQNGPDGLALVDPSNTVVQFISYEGRFAATAEAASSLTSVNVRVSETATTPVGYSLQLTSSGWKYAGFHWFGATAHTRDAINGGQTFNCPPPTAPNNFASSARTDHRIDLKWQNNSAPLSGYKVYRSSDEIAYSLSDTLSSTTFNSRQKGLTAGTTYYFKVIAYNATGESDPAITSNTTLAAGLFSETWDSVTTPIWPTHSYIHNSTGSITGADNSWTWKTDTGITSTGFRTSGTGLELGKFAVASTTGTLTAKAQTSSIDLTTTNTIIAAFETKFDAPSIEADKAYTFHIRTETEYNNGGSGVLITLDPQTNHPFVRLQSIESGMQSNTVLSTYTLRQAGEMWFAASLANTGNALQVNYSLYRPNPPTTPFFSGVGYLNKIPRLSLNQTALSMQSQFTGSIDDIYLASTPSQQMQMMFRTEGESAASEFRIGDYRSNGTVSESAPFYRHSGQFTGKLTYAPFGYQRFIGETGFTKYAARYLKPKLIRTASIKASPAWKTLVTKNVEAPERFKNQIIQRQEDGWISYSLSADLPPSSEETDIQQNESLRCLVSPNGKYALLQSSENPEQYLLSTVDGTTRSQIQASGLKLIFITTDTQCALVNSAGNGRKLILMSPTGKVVDSFEPEYSEEVQIKQNPSRPSRLLFWTRDNISQLTIGPTKISVDWTYAAYQAFDPVRAADSYKLWDLHDEHISPHWKYIYLQANKKVLRPDGNRLVTKQVLIDESGSVVWAVATKDMTKTWELSISPNGPKVPPSKQRAERAQRPRTLDEISQNDIYRMYDTGEFLGFIDDGHFGIANILMDRKAVLNQANELLVPILACKDRSIDKCYRLRAPDLKQCRIGRIKLMDGSRLEITFQKDGEMITDVYELGE